MTRGGLSDDGKEIIVKGSFIDTDNIGSIVKGSIVKGTLLEIAEEPVEIQVSDSISVQQSANLNDVQVQNSDVNSLNQNQEKQSPTPPITSEPEN